MIFSFFVYIQAKYEKNHDFWRGHIFPILSSPMPDFHQNFTFLRPPAGKISHKSDITIPFLDQIASDANPSKSPRHHPLLTLLRLLTLPIAKYT